MFASILFKSAAQQCIRAVFIQVNLPIFLLIHRCFTTNDDAIPPFIEDLGHARKKSFLVERPVKAHADETCLEATWIVNQLPRNSVCFVVQRRVEVPCPCGFVLKGANTDSARTTDAARSLLTCRCRATAAFTLQPPHYLRHPCQARELARIQKRQVKPSQSHWIAVRFRWSWVTLLGCWKGALRIKWVGVTCCCQRQSAPKDLSEI